ncbi:MarR family winged helix-turn-helix transcriptional regulator [Flavobacterium columnare]|uniref:MarR family transcriptional regulator n=1 Tax=Flavobacterium columnare TaxID=996 RepID=A0AAI8GAX6_9FLAO|nr:winged helix DNA-binding protein [Flavobacterium columnare]AMO20001.1 MarR family transcriptional regulator [Flavobacterium columnare]ANO48485.1 transcriptional regulator, MarR family protein [Flavobacterium columnare]APT23455.1 MarR family transcriptional regulator [Flavobacterium columnare]AUX17947.1 MarR family transcriptional regulator [Flavobacterium columnare]MEB3800877.1 MarR family transcriptional regulator [Flavobacterium columnare]
MNTDFFIQLLLQVKEFEQEVPIKANASVEDFRLWMNEKAYQNTNPTTLFKKKKKTVFDIENEIAKQVILLGRFSKQMIRRGLKDFPQLANEEFTYLYRIIDEESLTKMQLIERNAHEKQTGIEIIKRLVKNLLLEEFPDKKDKRITRLRVTQKGKSFFNESVEDVTQIARILSAKLDEEEKKNLLSLLKKLNEFHFNVYHNHKDSSIDQINELI